MVGASQNHQSKQKVFSSSREADKYAFSEASSDNFVAGEKDNSNRKVDSLSSDDVPSKHSHVFTSNLPVANVLPQPCTNSQIDVLVELLKSLNEVITKFESAVHKCLSFQAAAGLSDFPVSSPQTEVNFGEHSITEASL